jgi:hypothetical protein
MAAVTTQRLAAVYAGVTDVLARTSESSLLPGAEQDRLLAAACAQVCDLLKDWLTSEDWRRMRPSPAARVADAVARREDYARFLDQALEDVMTRASRAAAVPSLAAWLVAEARAALERVAGRHLWWTQRELFGSAESRMRELRAETCKLAGDLGRAATAQPTGEAGRRRARTALKTVVGVVPALVLAMAGASPPQMEANLLAWGHDAVRVVTTYLIAELADPKIELEAQIEREAQIEPPELSGPELS